MEKRRVYQVSKEQKLSSDALISMLKSLGFEVKSHMSVVTDEMLEGIKRKLEEEKKSSIEEVKRQKEKEKSRKEAEKKLPVEEKIERREPEKKPKPAPRKRSAQSGTGGTSQGQRNLPLPEKEGEAKRHGKRRGKAGQDAFVDEVQGLAEKREVTVQADSSNSRRRGGKRRRTTDVRAVQETVRKTLSQINEGRTRRRYDRELKDVEDNTVAEETKTIKVGEFITVSQFAQAMGVKPNEVIAICLQMGLMATINQRLDMDTMATVGLEFSYNVEPLDADELEEEEEEETSDLVDVTGGDLVTRSPVVTVMGHVDHGKTSLLDYLRKTNVVGGESGGITQHIGAYAVKMSDGRSVTFLDTPGHAAFTAMRARGARVTDLVILIVAADDGVKPQTIEAINHARDARVSLVVAINKVDLPTADPDRIKRELADRNVLIEEWGGRVPCIEISAKTGQGIEELLEVVLIAADLLELKAIADKQARGVVVEAKLDKGRGPVATVLVQEGTLRVGDPFITGAHSGRVRAMLNEHGHRIEEAGPSTPVQVLGLPGVPQAGDQFSVTTSEREAKDIALRRHQVRREQEHHHIRTVTLIDLHEQIRQGQIRELRVIVKGDVDGSVEAIAQELGSITHDEVRVQVIHSGVGPVSESDVLLAAASGAIVIGFHLSTDPAVRGLAEEEGVEIRNYKVIYEIIEDVRAALLGMLAPTFEENVIGTAEVRQVFRSSRFGLIAGCIIQKGKISRNSQIRILRAGEQMFKGGITSLRRFKDDVREVGEGFECGIGIEGFDDLQEGDMVEAIESVETLRTL